MNNKEENLNYNLTINEPANCSQCGDRSGAYYDKNGEVCQCQWCDEFSNLRIQALIEEK